MSELLPKKEIAILRDYKNIAIATSGGIDSMVLCDAMLKNSILFSIIHCNFQLRGAESDAEENFVKSYAVKHNIPFFSRKFDTKKEMQENKTSLEMTARHLRYEYFDELIDSEKFDLILTAHHSDDNAETVLMRIILGTGIQGLSGISKSRTDFYRPLLTVSRADIEDYAIENQIDFMQDSSNSDTDILRNKLRHHIIPSLEMINPKVKSSINQLSDISKEVEALLDDDFSDIKSKFLETEGVELAFLKTKNYKNLVLYYLFEEFSPNSSQIETLSSVLFTPESKIVQIGNRELEVKNGRIELIHDNQNIETKIYSDIKDMEADVFFNAKETNTAPPNYESSKLYFDRDRLKFPITKRGINEGDRITPLGMNGKSKKVVDVIKTYKLSNKDKQRLFVLVDNENEVVSISDKVVSEKVKITPKTKHVLVLSIQ